MIKVGSLTGTGSLVVALCAAAGWVAAVAQADVAPPAGVGLTGSYSFDTFTAGSDDGAVNLANGNLVLTTTDVPIPSTSNGNQLGRTYNSALVSARDVGSGWAFDTGYDVRLVLTSATDAVLATRTGFGEHFTKNGVGVWVAADAGYTLTASGSGYVASDGVSGRSYTFDGSGQLTAESLPGGQALSFTYTSAGGQSRLSSIHDPAGTNTWFSYNGNGSAIEADTPNSHHFYWTYDSQNRLSTFKDDLNQITTYSYSGTSTRLSHVAYPDGAALDVGYDTAGKASSVTVTPAGGTATTTGYAYASAGTLCAAGSTTQTTITYSNGSTNTLCFDAAGAVTYSNAGGDDDAKIEDAAPDPANFDPDFGDGDDGSCDLSDDPLDTYCGADDSTEPSDELPIADASTSAFRRLQTASTLNFNWGISDNNPIHNADGSDGLNIFADTFPTATPGTTIPNALTTVELGRARLVIPFNIESVGGQDLNNARDWVAAALSAGKRPLLSLERCRNLPDEGCKTYLPGSLPSTAYPAGEYHDAFKAILDDPAFAGVTDFTSWNEPDHTGYQPTATVPYGTGTHASDFNGAKVAGRYWHIANKLCSERHTSSSAPPKCNVAAGDFLDSAMTNVGTDSTFGKAYLTQYRKGMQSAPQAWAWHPYSDTQAALDPNSTASTRWKRFRAFLKATNGSNRSVWITEVGVYKTLWKANEPQAKISNSPAERRTLMNRLLNELPAVTFGSQGRRVKRFYYYEWRGDTVHVAGRAQLDTGLANGDNTAREPVFNPLTARVNG